MKEITILTLLAGRHYSLEAYLWGLSIIDYPKDKIRLLWSSNSQDKTFHKKARKEMIKIGSDYMSFRYIQTDKVKSTKNAFIENGAYTGEHAEAIAKLYNDAFKEVQTEWVLLLEDDVIAPSNAMDLFKCWDKNTGYACGSVMDRHGQSVFVFDLIEDTTFPNGDSCNERQSKGEIIKNPWGRREIGLGHFGLTLLRKSIIEKLDRPYFKPRDNKYGGALIGCDMVLCLQLANDLKLKRICDFNIRGLHLDSKGKIH